MTLQPEPGADLLLPVDREHNGIRTAGCGIMLLVWALTFAGATLLFNLSPLFALMIALVAAVAATAVAERLMKGRWPSGREIIANEQRIVLQKHGQTEREIDVQQSVNVLAWYFVVERSRRVRKGWRVVGLSLEQEGDYLPVYTLVSPDDFEKLNEQQFFKKLEKPKTNDDSKQSSLRQAGEQRRLLAAEQDRGYNGAELMLEDFQTYLAYLQTQHANWMVG